MIMEITPDEFWAHEEVHGLIEEYEVECRTAGLPIANPDLAMYNALHQAGFMKVWAAITDGVIVGFAVVITSRVAHYSAKLAVMESLYVAPQHRASGVGWRLIKKAEQQAKDAGITGLFISTPARGVLEAVMQNERTGYEHTNTVFYKAF